MAKHVVSETYPPGGGGFRRILPHRRPRSIGHARRTALSQGNLRLAQACGMLGPSGWGMLEQGGILQFCLAA
jgi:hypothetical protein